MLDMLRMLYMPHMSNMSQLDHLLFSPQCEMPLNIFIRLCTKRTKRHTFN
jgi:hypothetical protein